jgi:hypothetical protein
MANNGIMLMKINKRPGTEVPGLGSDETKISDGY